MEVIDAQEALVEEKRKKYGLDRRMAAMEEQVQSLTKSHLKEVGRYGWMDTRRKGGESGSFIVCRGRAQSCLPDEV